MEVVASLPAAGQFLRGPSLPGPHSALWLRAGVGCDKPLSAAVHVCCWWGGLDIGLTR